MMDLSGLAASAEVYAGALLIATFLVGAATVVEKMFGIPSGRIGLWTATALALLFVGLSVARAIGIE